MYNANAHVLLHEDNCFRFEARGSRPDGADGALTVQLLDPDRTEVTAGALSRTSPGLLEKAVEDSLRPVPSEPLLRLCVAQTAHAGKI